MTVKEVVAELETYANPQTKKTWMNHGAKEPCLGVKVEDMKKIVKRVKMDYQLALDLYDTGIADAMYLAGLIADDAKMTKKDLQKWIENATNFGWIAQFAVPWVASGSPYGREVALEWMDSKVEITAAAGWQTYSSMIAITDDAKLDQAEIKLLLERVANTIHEQPNDVKQVMNSFVIPVGCYFIPLHDLAVETGTRIGKVSVELVGSCKMPFAPESIQKFAARSPIGKKRKSAKC